MSQWYKFRAQAGGAEIAIYDEIGAFGIPAKAFLNELKAFPSPADVTLRINSPGGSVFDGVAIYNALTRGSRCHSRARLLQRSTDLTNVSFPVLVPFQSTVYDTDVFWDAGNPSRLTIPAGVTKVRLQGSLSLKPSATTGGVFISFEKNGAGSAVGSGVFTVRQGTSGYTNNDFSANTAVIPVSAGDYFELRVNSTSSSWDDIQAGNRTWFAVEVVETDDAANPPYDFSWSKEGQPGASEIMFRQVLARRVRLEVDFAGSAGLAGTAATADADFDVRQNGTSIGTIRFTAGATASTFVAANAATLDTSDVLTVVAPASVDANLADLAITIAGDLTG